MRRRSVCQVLPLQHGRHRLGSGVSVAACLLPLQSDAKFRYDLSKTSNDRQRDRAAFVDLIFTGKDPSLLFLSCLMSIGNDFANCACLSAVSEYGKTIFISYCNARGQVGLATSKFSMYKLVCRL